MTTRTYAVLEVSWQVFAEISKKLRDAGYDHAFNGGVIDMHGIALSAKANDKDECIYWPDPCQDCDCPIGMNDRETGSKSSKS